MRVVAHAEFTSGSALDVVFTVEGTALLGGDARVLNVMVGPVNR